MRGGFGGYVIVGGFSSHARCPIWLEFENNYYYLLLKELTCFFNDIINPSPNSEKYYADTCI